MTVDNIFDWIREHPRRASHDFALMCQEKSFTFQFAKRCSDCPYNNGDTCNVEAMAEEIREL